MTKEENRDTCRPLETLLPYQRAWLQDQSRFKIGLWSRQVGKSVDPPCPRNESAIGEIEETQSGSEWNAHAQTERNNGRQYDKTTDFENDLPQDLFEKNIKSDVLKSLVPRWHLGYALCMLRLENVSKSYQIGKGPQIEVLKDLSMELPEKCFISVRGPSGSGKSTLLHLLGALDRPSTGCVWWDGHDLSIWPNHRLARWRNTSVGFIFQAYHLLPELTAFENVLFPAALNRRAAEESAMELLELVGLEKRAHHRPSELSGGEQQRVAIARALVNDPPFILADEPTGNLDEHTSREVANLLLELTQAQNKTLVMATHNIELADQADRRFRLVEGHLEEM